MHRVIASVYRPDGTDSPNHRAGAAVEGGSGWVLAAAFVEEV